MQPIKLLNNVQKARLLHSFLITEIPGFVDYLHQYTESVLDSKDELRAGWQNQLFGVDMWFELAEEVKKKTAKYRRELLKSSNVFGDQLFDGYLAMFLVHVLVQYTKTENCDVKFKQAVDFFFA